MRPLKSVPIVAIWLKVAVATAQQITSISSSVASGSATPAPAPTTISTPCMASNVTTIRNQSDADSIASCRTFSGSISIESSIPSPIYLDGIETLNGTLTSGSSITADQLRIVEGHLSVDVLDGNISFPGLTTLGDDVFLKGISSMAMPRLERIDGGLDVRNTRLSNITLESLKSVGWYLSIALNDDLSVLSMPQLETVGTWFEIHQTPSLNTVILDSLRETLDFEINGNLTSLTFPSLHKIQGSLGIGSLSNIDETCNRLRGLDIQGSFTCVGDLDELDVAEIHNSSDNELNTAGKVGIGIGVVVAIIVLLLALWYHNRRRQARKRRNGGILMADLSKGRSEETSAEMFSLTNAKS